MKSITIFLKFNAVIFLLALFSCEGLEQISPENSGLFRSSKKSKTVKLESKLTARTPVSYELRANQVYGNDPFQVYDLYTPVFNDTLENVPSVSLVMIHGGGWSLLDKSYLNSVVEEFKKQGVNLTIFNINHRLAGTQGVNFPQIMSDIDQFFAHHQNRKSELNLSDEVLLWGYSSGGHLALSYAYMYPKSYITSVAGVAAPVDLTTPAVYNDLRDDKNRNLTELLIGVPYTTDAQAYKSASPVYAVSKSCVPTLLFYGGQDKLIDDEEQGKAIYTQLNREKVKTEFQVIPDATHDMHGKMPGIVSSSITFWKSIDL